MSNEPTPGQGAGKTERAFHVLVVEDNEANAIYAITALEYFGCRVSRVTDGEQAVNAASQIHFDAVFMDYNLPRLNGAQATQRIRAAEAAAGRAPVLVIGITASDDPQAQTVCLQAGMDELLMKPFLLGDIQSTLERIRYLRSPK